MKYLNTIIERMNEKIKQRRYEKTVGEPANYPIQGQPRIMRSSVPEKVDFNTWATHIWNETRKKY
jgi:hypothetical protein